MNEKTIEAAADRIWQAHETGTPCDPVRELIGSTDEAAAYAVQEINTCRWLTGGRRLVGRKIGLTSRAVQKQFGIANPDYGMLYADMSVGDGEEIDTGKLFQPKIEGEIAFVLDRDLDGQALTLSDVMAAVDYAVAAIEVPASRISDWDITVVDTIADNASSGVFVMGTEKRRLDEIDLRLCGMVIEQYGGGVSGEPVSLGAGAACLGNPLNATLWLARKMVDVKRPLKAGDVVFSGALGPMVAATPGAVYELKVNGLGSVRAVFSDQENA